MRCFFFSTSLTFALCGYGRNKSERPLKREEKRCFSQICLPRAMLADLQRFSLQCHGALDKCIWENQFFLAPKPWGWWENPPVVRRGTFWVLGPSSDTSLRPHILYFLFCQEFIPCWKPRWSLWLHTPPMAAHNQGLLQGLNHQGGTQGTVFSITDGLQSQKKSLLSYFLQG